MGQLAPGREDCLSLRSPAVVSLKCSSQAEIQRHLREMKGGGSANQGKGVHQLDAMGLEEEEKWLSVIKKEERS